SSPCRDCRRSADPSAWLRTQLRGLPPFRMWWPFPLPNVVCFAQSRARAFGIQYTSSRMVASAHGKAVAPISKPGPGDFRAAIPATPGSGSSVVGYGFGTLDQPVRPGNFRRSRTHVGPADDALERTGDIAAPGDHRLVK